MSYEFGPLVAMETMNGSDWYVFDKQENFDEFVKTLNQKGVRGTGTLYPPCYSDITHREGTTQSFRRTRCNYSERLREKVILYHVTCHHVGYI